MELTEQRRREIAVKYGLRLQDVPGGPTDDADAQARRKAERMQAFAVRFGLRVQDLNPDLEIFNEVRGE